jgi:hypothetical protein
MVMAPAVGEAPIARKRVVRFNGVPVVPQVTVATCAQVSPLPVSVGRSGVEPFELLIQARMRLFAVGVMLAVGHEVASVVLPLLVNSVAVTAAVAVPGSRTSEQATIKAPTKERRSAAVSDLPLVVLMPPLTWTPNLAVCRTRLYLSRSSIVRGASTDRANS